MSANEVLHVAYAFDAVPEAAALGDLLVEQTAAQTWIELEKLGARRDDVIAFGVSAYEDEGSNTCSDGSEACRQVTETRASWCESYEPVSCRPFSEDDRRFEGVPCAS